MVRFAIFHRLSGCVGGTGIQFCNASGFLCSPVDAKSIRPIQGKNRCLSCFPIAGLAILPDDRGKDMHKRARFVSAHAGF